MYKVYNYYCTVYIVYTGPAQVFRAGPVSGRPQHGRAGGRHKARQEASILKVTYDRYFPCDLRSGVANKECMLVGMRNKSWTFHHDLLFIDRRS